MLLIPTILEKDYLRAEEKIRLIKDKCRWIQIDVTDGFFLNGKSFELELLNKLEKEIQNNLLEIHLMVKEPIKWIEKCNFVGASRIIGQVEMMEDRKKFVEKIKDMGLEAGLAFKTETDIEEIPTETDIVLLMGRKTGFGNEDFEDSILNKIQKLVKLRNNNETSTFKIGLDGGVDLKTIEKIKNTGVEIAYCGRAIFDGMVDNNLQKLNYAINN